MNPRSSFSSLCLHGDNPFEILDVPYSEIQRSILPVVSWQDNRLQPWGTGFAITATGAVLTARHVVERFVEDHKPATLRGAAGLYVILETDTPLPSGNDNYLGGPLPVISVDLSPVSDIALLKVQLPRFTGGHLAPKPLALNVGLPHAGEECVAVAYARMATQGEVPQRFPEATDATTVEYDRRLAVSRGSVRRIYPEARDPVLLNFPCFELDSRFDFGMSGGPVFDEEQRVVGVVSIAMEPNPEGGRTDWMSHAALLAAALKLATPRNGKLGEASIVDMAQAGTATVFGIEALQRGEDGHYSYEAT